jgi:hypothetical protein
MSHYTRMKTRITDSAALTRALAEVGFPEVEVHAVAQPLVGFQGDLRAQTAEVIVRRKHLGRASNDLGFKRQPDGTFEAVVSAFDRSTYSGKWLDRLTARYTYHVTRARLQEQGFQLVTEETQADGRLHLVLRRMA